MCVCVCVCVCLCACVTLYVCLSECRVLVYNPREILAARRVQELVTNLHYPNGVQLSPDESYLLIGEGGRARIFR